MSEFLMSFFFTATGFSASSSLFTIYHVCESDHIVEARGYHVSFIFNLLTGRCNERLF